MPEELHAQVVVEVMIAGVVVTEVVVVAMVEEVEVVEDMGMVQTEKDHLTSIVELSASMDHQHEQNTE